MDWNFQHVHFLTTRTMIKETSDMLSLILPSIFQILETFKCTFKSIMANNGVVQHANYGVLRGTQYLYDSICRADKIYFGEYSFGESIISLRHNRERESSILLSTPGMNSSEKLNSDNAMYHRTIIGYEASVMNNKFLWSVLIVKNRSRRSDCKYIQEKNIP